MGVIKLAILIPSKNIYDYIELNEAADGIKEIQKEYPNFLLTRIYYHMHIPF